MPVCRFCGAQIMENDPFCMNCGAPVLKEGETLEPVRIDAPEGAEVIISDAPPEIMNMTNAQAEAVLKKSRKK